MSLIWTRSWKKPWARIAPFLPEAPAGRVVALILNQLAPRLWQGEDFGWLQGKTARIDISDLAFGISLSHNGRCFTWSQQPAQVTLGADAADMLAMLRNQTDPDTLFFQRRLKLSGDTELGLHLKNWLDATDRDALYQLLPRRWASWLNPQA